MSLKIFKPNPKNTGSLFTFNFGPAKKGGDLKGDLALYVSTVLQASWDGANKTGSFKENAKNPAKTLRMKLNEFEIGGILNAIERRVEFKGYHSHDGRAGHIQFSFSPSKDPTSGEFRGFFFSILRDGKEKFSAPITAGEAKTLASFCDFGLKTLFANRFKLQASFVAQGNGAAPARQATQKPAETAEEGNPFEPEQPTEPAAPAEEASQPADQSGADENPFG